VQRTDIVPVKPKTWRRAAGDRTPCYATPAKAQGALPRSRSSGGLYRVYNPSAPSQTTRGGGGGVWGVAGHTPPPAPEAVATTTTTIISEPTGGGVWGGGGGGARRRGTRARGSGHSRSSRTSDGGAQSTPIGGPSCWRRRDTPSAPSSGEVPHRADCRDRSRARRASAGGARPLREEDWTFWASRSDGAQPSNRSVLRSRRSSTSWLDEYGGSLDNRMPLRPRGGWRRSTAGRSQTS